MQRERALKEKNPPSCGGSMEVVRENYTEMKEKAGRGKAYCFIGNEHRSQAKYTVLPPENWPSTEYNNSASPPRERLLVELHTHFDGALRAETVVDLARTKGIELPVDNAEQLKEYVSCANKEVKSLTVFLEAFGIFNSVIRGDRDALRRCALEFCEDQANYGVLYSEVRYCPQFMCGQKPNVEGDSEQYSLTSDEVVQILLDAFAEGSQRYGIKVRSILCLVRPFPEWAAETVALCKKYYGKGVVGIDVAGDETLYPIVANDEFVKAFQEAKKFGIHRTAHAGEAGPAQNIRESLDWLSAERIGHGYHLVQDEELYNVIKKEKIHLELCPTSSILTGSVPSFKNHPGKRFINDGFNFSINSDDSLCINSTVADEYNLVYNEWGYDFPVLTRAAFNAARSSFLPEEEKRQLIEDLETVYGMR
ncbi:Adenosine deaminase [Trichoplax sp. H2]|nr:Adenosine deaminase [Trichoplax sp. H2]|eukprot:RDD39542.1 Adenosine deaminase [Trichoplax sp. H2]